MEMLQGVSFFDCKSQSLVPFPGCLPPQDTSKDGANNSCNYALKLGRHVILSTTGSSHALVPEPIKSCFGPLLTAGHRGVLGGTTGKAHSRTGSCDEPQKTREKLCWVPFSASRTKLASLSARSDTKRVVSRSQERP